MQPAIALHATPARREKVGDLSPNVTIVGGVEVAPASLPFRGRRLLPAGFPITRKPGEPGHGRGALSKRQHTTVPGPFRPRQASGCTHYSTTRSCLSLSPLATCYPGCRAVSSRPALYVLLRRPFQSSGSGPLRPDQSPARVATAVHPRPAPRPLPRRGSVGQAGGGSLPAVAPSRDRGASDKGEGKGGPDNLSPLDAGSPPGSPAANRSIPQELGVRGIAWPPRKL